MPVRFLVPATILGFLCAGGTVAQDWETMAPITPRGYVCYRTEAPLLVDGRLSDPAWAGAPWTDFFVDIRGDDWPKPRFRTRAKLLWDNDFLYVGALLEEPHVWGRLIERNSVIYHDNDFEIFIDPDGDNHNYYEFEVNALNTIWELTLRRPYKDGGPVVDPTNIKGLKSAVHVDGSLNAPHDTDVSWSVEIALPWSGLAKYTPGSVPPQHGDQWRVNFSRVQWQHQIEDGAYRKTPDTPEDNWVWSPQGIVDMHRPERWGYVQFSAAAPGTDGFVPDPTLPARDLLMKVYHAQKAFRKANGRWAENLQELGLSDLARPAGWPRVSGFEMAVDGFLATASDSLNHGGIVTLRTNEKSRIWRAP